MTQERRKRVAEMIAVFAKAMEFDRTNEEKRSSIWLIKRYCQEYEELLAMGEEE